MLATIRIRREHCTRHRFRYSECVRCMEACPHAALTLSEDGVAIDGARCRNCGLCAAVCPTEALVATNATPGALLAAANGLESFSIACAPSEQGADAIVPCLGAVDAVTLAALGRRGVVVELRGATHCGGCEHGERGAGQLAAMVEGLECVRRASAEPSAPPLVALQESRPTGHAPSRRHLLRRFLGRGVDAIADCAEPDAAPVPMRGIRVGAPVSVARRELMRTVWPRETDGQHDLESHVSLGIGQVAMDPARCRACEACARVCPTAAIEVAETSLEWMLAFRASRCTDCGVCVEACQPEALSMAGRVSATAAAEHRPTVLHRVHKKRCARCDRAFLAEGDGDQCPTCQGDDDDMQALFG